MFKKVIRHMRLYILLIILVAVILIIGLALINMPQKIEFAKVKAKTHTYEDLPGLIKTRFKAENETIPERGFYFFSDVGYPEEFVVDVDKKTVKYLLSPSLGPEKEGTIHLSDKQSAELVAFINRIWASESDFESVDFTARVTFSILVLVDKDTYRWFDFGGLLEGEVAKLVGYLVELVPKVPETEQDLTPQSFPFFTKTKIFIKGVPSLNTGDTQRAIDAETGLEYWKYIAVKDGERIEIGKFYSTGKDGTITTSAGAFNFFIKEEGLNLNNTQAKEFSEMVLKLSFGSVYDGGEIKNVTEDKGVFKATARLRQTIGMVPYHDESDLEFSFNKDGTIIQFKQGKWEEVEGH